jgi:aspartyl-tRNA(Asn)/glutamyl-tRNA(Gln) amidotransferase subunit A
MLRQQILAVLQQVDVLIMPTSSVPATLIPTKAGINSKEEVLEGYAGRRSFTAPFNLANLPAMSINCGFTSGNLPIGLQLAGKPFTEETLFRVAHSFEQATDWHNRRTPI